MSPVLQETMTKTYTLTITEEQAKVIEHSTELTKEFQLVLSNLACEYWINSYKTVESQFASESWGLITRRRRVTKCLPSG